MPVAARVDPKSYFLPEEWTPLTVRSSWKGLWLIAHAWIVIAAAAVVGVLWPLTIPLVVMIIGARQLGLAVLMHDAAHGALHPNLRINDWAGEWLTTGGLSIYRPYHLQHHRFAQQSEDPDLVLSAPFPITRLSMRRKVIRDLTGQTYYRQRWSGLVARIRARKRGQPLLPILKDAVVQRRRFLIGAAATIAATAPFGLWWAWFVFWLLPKATWLPLVARLRNIAEHACVAKDEPDPLRHARTTHANWLVRAFLAPYYVNYHCEHHMFMHLPCYHLPRAHRLLRRKGATGAMEVQPGYWTVLRMASARPAGAKPAGAK